MLQQRLDNKVCVLFCGRVVGQKVTQYTKRHIDKNNEKNTHTDRKTETHK